MKEVIQKIIAHQAEGVVFHDMMIDYFDFLGLDGFMKLHEHQAVEEACEYREMKEFFIDHFQTMYAPIEMKAPSVIPNDWQKHKTTEINAASVRTLTKNAFDLYLKWEKETRELYKECAKALKDECIECYYKVLELLDDVEKEIRNLDDMMVDLQVSDYDAKSITKMQCKLKREFKYKD